MGARQEAQTFFYLREISEGEGDMGTWGGGGLRSSNPVEWEIRVGLNEGSRMKAGVWG